MLSAQQALKNILSDPNIAALKKRGTEQLPITQALGRVLAKDQVAGVDVPPWDNSAMDGYAFSLQALIDNDNTLPVSQIIPAGTAPQTLKQNTCARIFTGAPIPAGADTVEMQENTEPSSKQADAIVFANNPKPGANIRKQGEDIAKGQVVVSSSTVLQSAHIGLLASVGIGTVPLRKRLKVAILSTGDELVDPLDDLGKQKLDNGKIYNSNRYLLFSMLQQLDCEVVDGGMVKDNLAATEKQLQELSERADIIISTGGVSVGDEDYVKTAVEAVGKLSLWKIAIKPGKPLAFGHINKQAKQLVSFFGLPGNPVSAFVTFLLFVKPFLLAAQGNTHPEPRTLQAVAGFDWPAIKEGKQQKPLKREEYLRAQLQSDSNKVEIFPNQSSGALSSAAWANCLAIAPVNSVIHKGDTIQVLLL